MGVSAAWERSVEVWDPATDQGGSGTVVAPGMVLTAWHVTAGRHPLIRRIQTAEGVPMEVVWSDENLDVALLWDETRTVGAGQPEVRWGELTVASRDSGRPECTAVGFPEAMVKDHIHDPQEIGGRIAPVTGLDSTEHFLEIDPALRHESPRHRSSWQGMSGAGVFCHDHLLGVLTQAPQRWQDALLKLPPSPLLLENSSFTAALTAYTGRPPTLTSADLSPAMAPDSPARALPSYLLSPHAAVADFTGMDDKLEALQNWCEHGPDIDVALVHGPGGVGKTRLAVELTHRLSAPDRAAAEERWTAGFLADDHDGPYEPLTRNSRPLLLVVDYAVGRNQQLREVLRALKRKRPSHRVRLLLLSRVKDRWWNKLCRAFPAQCTTGYSIEITTRDAFRNEDPADRYTEAQAAFAARITQLQDRGLDADPWATGNNLSDDPPPENPSGDIVSIHAAALSSVLRRAYDGLPAHEKPEEVLLAHEERHWERAAHAYGQSHLISDQGRTLMDTLIAVQRLLGAADRPEALAAIAAAHELHHRDAPGPDHIDKNRLLAICNMLAALYPPSGPAGTWGAVGPDLISGTLLSLAHKETDGQLLPHLLTHPRVSETQKQHTVHIIARTSEDHPQLAEAVLQTAIAAPETVRPLVDEAIRSQLPPAAAHEWAVRLRRHLDRHHRTADAQRDVRRPMAQPPAVVDSTEPAGPAAGTATPPTPVATPRRSPSPAARSKTPDVYTPPVPNVGRALMITERAVSVLLLIAAIAFITAGTLQLLALIE